MLFVPDSCFVHLTVSFSGDITDLVSAEMLADVFVLVTILTALPGIEENLLQNNFATKTLQPRKFKLLDFLSLTNYNCGC